MICCDNVCFAYGPERQALNGISFVIEDGESVGLTGANGAGKSTLMKVMLGLLFADSGTVSVDGVPVCRDSLKDIRKKLGFVLQDSDDQMFMPTVYEDMIFGPLNYGVSREETDERIDRVMSDLGIEDLKHRHNHRISGGEKRMAAIATILVMEPGTLLMDEPTSSLDPYNRRRVTDLIKGLKTTRLIASHDLDMILETCDRVIMLSDGKIAADGPAHEILTDRELLEKHHLELPLRYQR